MPSSALLDAPEWDNSLYVVDTRRFEYVEDNDSETLSGEWAPID